MLWGSSSFSEFCTSLSKVLTLWYCVKVKQRYLCILYVVWRYCYPHCNNSFVQSNTFMLMLVKKNFLLLQCSQYSTIRICKVPKQFMARKLSYILRVYTAVEMESARFRFPKKGKHITFCFCLPYPTGQIQVTFPKTIKTYCSYLQIARFVCSDSGLYLFFNMKNTYSEFLKNIEKNVVK